MIRPSGEGPTHPFSEGKIKHLRLLAAFAAVAGFASAQTPPDKDREIEDLKKRLDATERDKKEGGGSPSWKDLVSLGGHLKWYGFMRLDCHYTDSAFDNSRFPTFVRACEFLRGHSRLLP
ncbi:MAG: hypothetical protein FD180_2960 [Planctomycetota bacterium]|nr:MAG: hypothetical protein FD180_2960 [Planctomycetota bacterium]